MARSKRASDRAEAEHEGHPADVPIRSVDQGQAMGAADDLTARLQAHAAEAMALSEHLATASTVAEAAVQARLGEAARTVREVADDLQATAADLAKPGQTVMCEVTWGICEEHGVTLMATEKPLCRVIDCHRVATAISKPCDEHAEYHVVDVGAASFLACNGHAIAGKVLLPDAVITLVTDSLELL